MNLLVGIAGAFIGGVLVVSSLLGLHYAEGFNLVTLGAVLLLAVFGGFQNRRLH